MPEYRTPFPAMLAAGLQSGLNGVLSLDPESASRLDRIDGRVLKLELLGVGIDIFFTARQQQFEVSLEHPSKNDEETVADTTVSGTPAALFSMAAEEAGAGWGSQGSRVVINGDATLARDFERLFSRLDPDFEGLISGFVGDVAGHQIVAGLKQGVEQARETLGEATTVAGEIFRDGLRGGQSGPLVGDSEAREFSKGVEELRDAVDRLEAKIRWARQNQETNRDE